MHCQYSLGNNKKNAGFTLIEALLTIFILSVSLALVAPGLQELFIKNKIRRLADDFIQSIFKAKSTAAGKNICITMCASSTVDKASPSCDSKSASDWQPGWLVFLNENCDTSKNSPAAVADILEARVGLDEPYYLQSQSGVKRINFDGRGLNAISNASEFDIYYRSAGNSLNDKYGLNICLDALGRTRTIPSSNTCSNYK